MNFDLDKINHPKVKFGKTGVLLVNLGTPDSTSWRDIRKYLKEFLSDTRVIEVNPVLWHVPIVNLEWIQKIARDNKERGYSAEATVDTILRRMPDYINHICPQFSLTDINFQRIPTVDTSNPFFIQTIPTADESFVIIHFRKVARDKWGIDFTYLLDMIHDSFMSTPTSIVVNGGKMGFAMELILTPIIHRMIEEKKKLA